MVEEKEIEDCIVAVFKSGEEEKLGKIAIIFYPTNYIIHLKMNRLRQSVSRGGGEREVTHKLRYI